MSSLFHLQRSIGNQAARPLPQAGTENLEPSSVRNPSTGLAHDFSRIPLHAGTRNNIQLKPKLNAPGDIYEREAERVADQVALMPDSQLRGQKEEDGFRAGRPATPDIIGSSAGGSGQFCADSLRCYFEPRLGYDFSRVRIHSDAEASRMAEAVNARAFTVGRDIVFGSRAYAPHTAQGRRLMAHELTHVIQQGGAERIAGRADSFLHVAPGHLQRDIAEDQLPNTDVRQIMADESYFQNGVERLEFYGAELAILYYPDGSQIELGLVPEQISPPFEAVDYRTPASAHHWLTSVAPSPGRGSISFVPRGREAQVPPESAWEDVLPAMEDISRTIGFTHHPNGRIVPTEVNSLSAPLLCQVLRESEAEYVRRFDEMAAGAVETLEMMEWIVILSSLVGGLGAAGTRAGAGRAAAGRAGVGAASRLVGRAQATLSRFFARLLRTGASEAITVEGVGFGGVRAAMRGTELVVSRNTIVNASRIPSQGRLIHGAFERAAIEAARQAGARTARVALELVQNPRWAAYLESQGYTYQLIANEAGGFTSVLTKVFTL